MFPVRSNYSNNLGKEAVKGRCLKQPKTCPK